MRQRSSKLRILAVLVGLFRVLCAPAAFAEECGVVPANPDRIMPEPQNPDQAFDLSEKGYLFYDRGDFHCAAYFNLRAYQAQSDPVLLQNVAATLKEGKQYDAALRYAAKTLTLNPDEQGIELANQIIAEMNGILSGDDYVQFPLTDYNATAMTIDFIRYERGDLPRVRKGKLSVVIERQGKSPSMETIEVPKPVVIEPPPVAASSSDWRMTAGIVAGGTGVALLGVTIGLDLSASSKRDDYDGLRACLEGPTPCEDGRTVGDYNTLGSEIETLTSIETVTLICGGVLTVAGVALIVWQLVDSKGEVEDEEPGLSLMVAPNANLDGSEVLLRWTF